MRGVRRAVATGHWTWTSTVPSPYATQAIVIGGSSGIVRHSREEVVERTIREFALLDQLIAGLSEEDWKRPVLRPEGKDPWTVQDALAHITFWKADIARSI